MERSNLLLKVKNSRATTTTTTTTKGKEFQGWIYLNGWAAEPGGEKTRGRIYLNRGAGFIYLEVPPFKSQKPEQLGNR